MSYPTWGIPITGYSNPSAAAVRKFNKLYPGAAEAHSLRCEQVCKAKELERTKILRKERETVAACTHAFASTNAGGVVCTKCHFWWALPNNRETTYKRGPEHAKA